MAPNPERAATVKELEDVRKTIGNTKIYQFVGWRFLTSHLATYVKNKTPRTAGWLAYELEITRRRAAADEEYIIETLTETLCRLIGVDASYSQHGGAKKTWPQLQALLQQETQLLHSLWRLQAIRGDLEAASIETNRVTELNRGVLAHITELLNRVGLKVDAEAVILDKVKQLRSG
ncbi:hypothetical protein PT974_08945 [Cladobotryum mycophilum]|uniref:Prion-inhibition and propagation HeLo domain-containing protein n=1 Tax=Cladobotryum mycophilum TaxID=491253 RepID=A0ABR0SFR7_9HYPO